MRRDIRPRPHADRSVAEPELWGYTVEKTIDQLGSTELETVQAAELRRGRRRRTVAQASARGTEPVSTWTFTPVLDGPIPPFTLHLIGKDEGKLTIPPELLQDPGNGQALVQIHSNGEYPEFYRTIFSMVSGPVRLSERGAKTRRT